MIIAQNKKSRYYWHQDLKLGWPTRTPFDLAQDGLLGINLFLKNKSRQQKEVGIQFKLGWPTRTPFDLAQDRLLVLNLFLKNKSRQQEEVGIQFKLGWPTRTRTLNDGTKNRSVANYTMGQSLLTTLF